MEAIHVFKGANLMLSVRKRDALPQSLGEFLHLDHIAWGEGYGSFDHVLKFADITGPLVVEKKIEGVRRKTGYRAFDSPIGLFQEEPCKG